MSRLLLIAGFLLNATLSMAGSTGAAQSIILDKCVGCHSSSGSLTEFYGDFSDHSNLIESYVAPGSLKKSFLWDRIARKEMPPGNPLSKEEMESIKQWIESGAEAW